MNFILGVKNILGVRKYCHALVLLFTLLLTGCFQSRHPGVFYNIETEHAWIDNQQITYSLDLNQINFTPSNDETLFAFEENKSLLLKINFNEVAFDPQNQALTLLVSPTSLHDVVYYLSDETTNSAQLIHSQSKYQSSFVTPLSAQQYAFNVNTADLFKTHYILILSDSQSYIQISLYDVQNYFKAEVQNNQITTLIFTFLLAISLFCFVSYVFTHNKALLLHGVFSGASLWALLWQSKIINHLPWLLWPFIGPNSHLLYAFLAAFSAFALIHFLITPVRNHRWLIKLLGTLLLLQFGLLVYMAFPGLDWQIVELLPVNQLFNVLLLLTYGLILLALLANQTRLKEQNNWFIFAFAIMFMGVAIQVYIKFTPNPDLTWITRLYQISVVIAMTMMAVAIKYNTKPQEEVETLGKVVHAKPDKSIFKHRLISQFQQQMQTLADDTTLSEAEVEEKIHIKFHLLLTQAYPVRNSLILTDDEIEGVCTTGIDTPDIEFLRQLALEIAEKPVPECVQKLIGMAGDKQSNVLFVPLKKQGQKNVVFILTLKTNESLEQATMEEIQGFCDDAYFELCQARSRYETALAANLDSLTLCYNRESIKTIIKHSLDQKKLTTLAYLDLDNMKNHGDQQGVSTTNQLLAEFAQQLKNHLAATAKIGRIGSDEFLVVFSGYNIDTCMESLESFHESLQNQQSADEKPQLTCSTGVAESRMNESTRTLIKKANTAMQHAKNQGGNQIALYEVDMTS